MDKRTAETLKPGDVVFSRHSRREIVIKTIITKPENETNERIKYPLFRGEGEVDDISYVLLDLRRRKGEPDPAMQAAALSAHRAGDFQTSRELLAELRAELPNEIPKSSCLPK